MSHSCVLCNIYTSELMGPREHTPSSIIKHHKEQNSNLQQQQQMWFALNSKEWILSLGCKRDYNMIINNNNKNKCFMFLYVAPPFRCVVTRCTLQVRMVHNSDCVGGGSGALGHGAYWLCSSSTRARGLGPWVCSCMVLRGEPVKCSWTFDRPAAGQAQEKTINTIFF